MPLKIGFASFCRATGYGNEYAKTKLRGIKTLGNGYSVCDLLLKSKPQKNEVEIIAHSDHSTDIYIPDDAELTQDFAAFVAKKPALQERVHAVQREFLQALITMPHGGKFLPHVATLQEKLLHYGPVTEFIFCNDSSKLPHDWCAFAAAFAIINSASLQQVAA